MKEELLTKAHSDQIKIYKAQLKLVRGERNLSRKECENLLVDFNIEKEKVNQLTRTIDTQKHDIKLGKIAEVSTVLGGILIAFEDINLKLIGGTIMAASVVIYICFTTRRKSNNSTDEQSS